MGRAIGVRQGVALLRLATVSSASSRTTVCLRYRAAVILFGHAELILSLLRNPIRDLSKNSSESKMKAFSMSKFRVFSSLSVIVLFLAACASQEAPVPVEVEESRPQVATPVESREIVIPNPPENSAHGYLLEDDRIPTLSTCEEWAEFWVGSGPAVSFAVAEKYPNVENLEVSTQIYLKNKNLDPDENGIICFEEIGLLESLPENVNDQSRRLATEECKLRSNELGAGFPRPAGYLPADGTISAVMLFVEFTNVKITESIEDEARSYYEKFSEFIDLQSGGRQKWEFTVPDRVFSINKSSEVYGTDSTKPNFGSPNFRQYFQDAVSAADPFVDFSEFDVVYVIPPKSIGNSIGYGPSFPNLSNGYITSDEGSIRAGATAGNDSRLGNNSEPWAWLAHETGHLYGLLHPLDEQGVTDEFGRMSASDVSLELWDLMTWMRSPSPDLWGWSKFWIGWLSDTQVYCASKASIGESVKIHLTFSDREQLVDEISFVVIPLTSTKAIAIEARNLSLETRTLVQEINVNRGEREGQIQIVPANERKVEGWLDGALAVGESAAHEGLKITVLGQTKDGVVIEISGAP